MWKIPCRNSRTAAQADELLKQVARTVREQLKNAIKVEKAHKNDASPAITDQHSIEDEVLGRDGWAKATRLYPIADSPKKK